MINFCISLLILSLLFSNIIDNVIVYDSTYIQHSRNMNESDEVCNRRLVDHTNQVPTKSIGDGLLNEQLS
jgi:hypothetical protein